MHAMAGQAGHYLAVTRVFNFFAKRMRSPVLGRMARRTERYGISNLKIERTGCMRWHMAGKAVSVANWHTPERKYSFHGADLLVNNFMA